MKKPAFAFDGRNILPHRVMQSIGFEVQAIGKSLPTENALSESLDRVLA